MTSALVRGHRLVAEGAAYEDPDRPRRVDNHRTGGTGFAMCSCNARSEVLDSNPKRKAWHRAHKADVIAGRA